MDALGSVRATLSDAWSVPETPLPGSFDFTGEPNGPALPGGSGAAPTPGG